MDIRKNMVDRHTGSITALMTLLLAIIITGCDKSSDCCTIVDTTVQIVYKNSQGENLINSNADFDASNIKLYYKNGSDYQYAYDRNLAAPSMYRLDMDEEDNLVMTVYPSYYYEGITSTTLIALNEDVVDTLVCEFEIDTNREICTGAWLNGTEMNDRRIEVLR